MEKPYPTPPGTRAVREGSLKKRFSALAARSRSTFLHPLPGEKCPKRCGVCFFPGRRRFMKWQFSVHPGGIGLGGSCRSLLAASGTLLGALLGPSGSSRGRLGGSPCGGVPGKAFLGYCRLDQEGLCPTPPAREVSQEVWGVLFSTQAELPRSSNFQCTLVGGVLGGSCGGLPGSF